MSSTIVVKFFSDGAALLGNAIIASAYNVQASITADSTARSINLALFQLVVFLPQ